MAPIAEDFRRSGMTEEDLDALVQRERQAMWDEEHSEPIRRFGRSHPPGDAR
jgi:hypothetical protein